MMKLFQDLDVDGSIEGTSFIKTSGTSSQYLMADGSTSTASGTIGGSIAATQVAFGSATSDEISGESAFFYSNTGGLTIGIGGAGADNSSITLNKGASGQSRIQLQSASVTGFDIKLDGSEDTYMTASNTLTLATSGTAKDIILNPAGDVGVGNTTPGHKLDVTGRIRASKGLQVGDETSTTANAASEGTIRYQAAIASGTKKISVVEMCMQTGDSPNTYAWEVIYTTTAWA
tara:strand:- start:3 stop:698 length:696 start_codon:yes stop_codon:yes gene_type:complete